MMKMKKIIAIILSMALITSLFSCGEKADPKVEEPKETTKSTESTLESEDKSNATEVTNEKEKEEEEEEPEQKYAVVNELEFDCSKVYLLVNELDEYGNILTSSRYEISTDRIENFEQFISEENGLRKLDYGPIMLYSAQWLFTKTYEYDDNGNLIRSTYDIKDKPKEINEYTYDSAGDKKMTHTQYQGDDSEAALIEHFDTDGNVTYSEAPWANLKKEYTYDNAGNCISTVNYNTETGEKNGIYTISEYDDENYMIKQESSNTDGGVQVEKWIWNSDHTHCDHSLESDKHGELYTEETDYVFIDDKQLMTDEYKNIIVSNVESERHIKYDEKGRIIYEENVDTTVLYDEPRRIIEEWDYSDPMKMTKKYSYNSSYCSGKLEKREGIEWLELYDENHNVTVRYDSTINGFDEFRTQDEWLDTEYGKFESYTLYFYTPIKSQK